MIAQRSGVIIHVTSIQSVLPRTNCKPVYFHWRLIAQGPPTPGSPEVYWNACIMGTGKLDAVSGSMPARRPQFPWSALLPTCRSLMANLVANMRDRGIGGDIDCSVRQQLTDSYSHFPEFESLSPPIPRPTFDDRHIWTRQNQRGVSPEIRPILRSAPLESLSWKIQLGKSRKGR